jgi:hypothetical protein
MEYPENRHWAYSFQIAISIHICIFESSPDEKQTLLSDIICREVSIIRKSVDFFYIWRGKLLLKPLCSKVYQRRTRTVSDSDSRIIKFSISCIFTYEIFSWNYDTNYTYVYRILSDMIPSQSLYRRISWLKKCR